MLPSVKNENGANTKVPSKREQKKRINIRWNSTAFFQLGLVLLLCLSFIAMESDWSLGSVNRFVKDKEFTLEENALLSYRLEEPEVKTEVRIKKPVKQRIIQKPVTESFTPVSDDSKLPETNLPSTEINPNLAPTATVAPSPKKEPPTATYETVQFVPVFPGCESLSTNEERKDCMSQKINTFISRKFNADKYSYLDTDKTHVVNVLFTIGRDGKVKDIRARSVVPDLEEEATRVISKMPWMQPGMQGSIPVDVLFSVPIRFRSQ